MEETGEPWEPQSSRFIHTFLRSPRFDSTFPHTLRDTLKLWRLGRIMVNVVSWQTVFCEQTHNYDPKLQVFYTNTSNINLSLTTSLSNMSFLLARLHEVHRAIVVTSVVPVYVYVYVRVRVTLSVKVFYKSISLDHVDGSSSYFACC